MNLYYDPQDHGLELLGVFNWLDAPYEYDMTIVVRNQAGEIMYAEDAGCSCYSPFEYVQEDDLVVTAPAELQAYLEGRNNGSNYGPDQAGEIVELMGRIVG